jgi:hypothetical protein
MLKADDSGYWFGAACCWIVCLWMGLGRGHLLPRPHPVTVQISSSAFIDASTLH